ncbi:unnamed protein product, partial [Effrenium voratum]
PFPRIQHQTNQQKRPTSPTKSSQNFAAFQVARGLKRPKTESSGVTPAPPRKRHELTERSPQPEAKRRREERFDMSAAEYNLEARPVKDMDGMVRGGKELPSISAILKIAQGELEKWSEVLEIPRESKPQRRVRPFMWELEKLLEQNKEANPIILVPMNKNAPVNMLNVFDLLQEGRYRRPEQQGATGFGYFEALRKDHVKLVRHIDGRRWTFEVRDSTKGFSSKDWLRVVAVITNGDDWQFKGWPFKTVVSMFMTLKGFYFRERDRFVELPEHVSRWPVTILDLATLELQHRFAAVRDSFWKEVEHFMKSARSKEFDREARLEVERTVVRMKAPVL